MNPIDGPRSYVIQNGLLLKSRDYDILYPPPPPLPKRSRIKYTDDDTASCSSPIKSNYLTRSKRKSKNYPLLIDASIEDAHETHQ